MKHTRKRSGEDGAVMVEAVIYFPIVICLVIFLLYLAIMNMQEYLMLYEVQRVASVASKEIAYHGYENLGVGVDNEIDFKDIPDTGTITNYYDSYTEGISDIYREASGLLRAAGIGSVDSADYASSLGTTLVENTLIAVGNINEPDIDIDSSFFGTGITVSITHSIPVPGIFQYLGYKNGIEIKSAAYSYAVNPGGFVRNVDLAVDLTSYIFEKLGMSESFSEFKSKTSSVLSKIL